MASAYVVLILFFTIFETTATQQYHKSKQIRLGSSLSPSSEPSSWNSPSGLFQFGFYKQGTSFSVGISLVGNSDITIVWTAIRNHPPVSSNATLTLTMDGELILITEESRLNLAEDSDTKDVPVSFASMLDSGNFVLYNNRSDVIWSSFRNPTDTILGGQNLSAGSKMFSSVSETDKSAGRFRLDMQEDANLVLYPESTLKQGREAYWASNTQSDSYEMLNLSPTGVLQLLGDNKTRHIIANSSKSVESMNETVIYRATLDPDGILRLYSHRFDITGNSTVIIEWSALPNQCHVQGFCGLNSLCSPTNGSTKAECYCFPGFNFINPDKKFLGCYRNFSDEEGCKRKKPAEFYSITDMQITKLGGLAYAKLLVSKNDCSKSCLSDCYCGAAFYSNSSCSKFKLPIMFAMKDQNQSAMILIKSSLGKVPRIPPPASSVVKERVVADNKKKLITVLAACLGSITFLCFLIAIYSFLVYKVRVNRYERLRENANLGPTQEFILQSFSYTDLEQATNGFQEELGRGCFGAVYKGAISEGRKIIAVKRLESPVEEGERKFQAEMAAVRRTHHRNLVHLLGFCMQSSKKLLVYEFMNKGSLKDLLFDVERRPPWKERVRIALAVARGILYLHEECEVQIIHCDIKLRNILVDDSWNAKISDFGLAKILMPNQTGIIAEVRGSRGYMAPEWQSSGLITVKSDVYSFGVVLLEIVCCRSNFEVNVPTADEVILSSWVYNCFVSRELSQLIGEEGVDMKTLERMVKVGLLCIQNDPSLRPSMKNVILMLEESKDIPVPPFPNPLVNT